MLNSLVPKVELHNIESRTSIAAPLPLNHVESIGLCRIFKNLPSIHFSPWQRQKKPVCFSQNFSFTCLFSFYLLLPLTSLSTSLNASGWDLIGHLGYRTPGCHQLRKLQVHHICQELLKRHWLHRTNHVELHKMALYLTSVGSGITGQRFLAV